MKLITPTTPICYSYPVIVFSFANGFVLTTIDFEELSIEADNIQYGIDCIRSAIIQRTARSYPPSPAPVNELVHNAVLPRTQYKISCSSLVLY